MEQSKMKLGSLFSGIGGFDLGAERAGWEVVWQSEIEPHCLKVLRSRFSKATLHGDLRKLTASAPGCHARTYRLQASEKDSRENALVYFSNLRESCERFDPLGLSSRMFPDFSVQTMEETLQKSSAFSWSSAGMGFNGVCSTASISEWPNDVRVCSLSDILEPHAPPRFYLSPRACRGVLRRAQKRQRTLPSRLHQALEFVANLQDAEWKTILTLLCSQPVWGITGTQATGETESISSADRSKEVVGAEVSCQTQKKQPKDILSHPRRNRRRCSRCIGTATPTLLLVRRLTPTECEVLQGFPKGWTVPDIAPLETP